MSTSPEAMDSTDFEIPEPKGRVLVIAGSDSSGGAGIQADIKAISMMGGYAMTAITALTVQNTTGVSAVHLPPVEIITGQAEACLNDIGADVIKTGMLANKAIVSAVAALIAAHDDIPAIVDPVMVATSGSRLLDEDAIEAVKTELIPHAFLVTPNIPEAEVLTGIKIEDLDDQRAAGEALLKMGAWAALIKGAHLDTEQVFDVLVTRNGMRLFTRSRIKTKHTHGTGCTLASAIAGLMAQGLPLDQAVEDAGDYVHEAILHAPDLGQGNGPIDAFWPLRGEGEEGAAPSANASPEGMHNPFAGLGDMMKS
ncbi:bifunctional hydroxymethylpyrimidine kinase/phosphomethylpyrimidine kinase [Woodsholea maritima]|uniref:bifunctional hydroxymethylpyrimidine kinase/phosphomethylpyrimidine kinase n=1 Tax=Woodsholea maritima TaxID=240237 RepID=UPI0012EAE879|nr:bifunctional hydroxymethylpyrimidine kinase/phosphomethylpyrimidine kinase [Woodsholea maritima]